MAAPGTAPLGGLFAALLATVAACPAQAAKDRIAIVIGNEDYATIPDLANAGRDATDIAHMLRTFGFTVFEGHDLDRKGFEALIREAMLNTTDGGDVVFFYSGHGIQIGRRNYLLPVDVAFKDIYDLPVYSVTLDRVIEALAARGAAHLAIIDSCRENPFPNLRLAADLDATIFETQSGFDVFRTPLNSLVAFSTSPGEVAFDGDAGTNSPYAAAVLASVKGAPDEGVMELFAQVREAVYQATGGRQVPWESSTLVRPFRFLQTDQGAHPLVLAQAETDTTQRGLADGAAIDLNLPLDRAVDLSAALSQALGGPPVDPVLTDPPDAGAFDTGGLSYRPNLAETRATGQAAFAITDSFTLETGPAGQRQQTEVHLTLTAGACDIEAGDALDLQGVGLFRLPNEIDPAPALAACTAAIEARPDLARLRYQHGRAAQAGGDFATAFADFTAAAEAGHVRARAAMAYLLASDRIDHALTGIPLDLPRAEALWDQAIAAGDPYAMHSRGLRLLRGGAGPADHQRGFELLERAAELGHSYSMNELGIYFLTKDTDHYLPERGMKYLELSSARGDIYGYHNLGFVALYGLDGQPPDYRRAAAYFEKAAGGGHPKSPATLGRMIMRGQLGDPDPVKAVGWYDQGLARGDGWAGVNAAALILDGLVPGRDAADAAIGAAKAALLPDADAALEADKHLASQPRKTLDRALQRLLNQLGADLAEDGAAGAATEAALTAMATAQGVPATGTGAADRLKTAAALYWARHPVRADLY